MSSTNSFGSVLSQLVLDYLPKIKKGRALDLGCGVGATAFYLAQQGFYVDAVDRCEYPEFKGHSNINLIRKNIKNFALRPCEYDLIVANHILPFFSRLEQRKLLGRWINGLSTSGFFIATSFTENDDFFSKKISQGWKEKAPFSLWSPQSGYITFFRTNELKTILQGYNLMILHHKEYKEIGVTQTGEDHTFGLTEVVCQNIKPKLSV